VKGRAMQYLMFKYMITAVLVVVVSEVAKRNDQIGALIAALPLVTLLTLVWLYVEHQPASILANHAFYTFWYVLPTLPMFLLFAYGLPKYGFIPIILGCVTLTILLFVLMAAILKKYGIHLF